MEEATLVRSAARDAVDDVEPTPLLEAIDAQLASASMAPGAFTLRCATLAVENVDQAGATERGAGVQLIYEGLRLTRGLAANPPWETSDDHSEANLAILAADVMVSRGFYLLANTEAADRAVATVRRFGREQTDRLAGETTGVKNDLERSIFELGAVAGYSLGGIVPEAIIGVAGTIPEGLDDPLPPTETVLDGTEEALSSVDTGRETSGGNQQVRSSAGDS